MKFQVWQYTAHSLKQFAQKKGITNYQIAKNTGISQSTVKRFFDEKTPMNYNNLLKLTNFLNIDITLIDRDTGDFIDPLKDVQI